MVQGLGLQTVRVMACVLRSEYGKKSSFERFQNKKFTLKQMG